MSRLEENMHVDLQVQSAIGCYWANTASEHALRASLEQGAGPRSAGLGCQG